MEKVVFYSERVQEELDCLLRELAIFTSLVHGESFFKEVERIADMLYVDEFTRDDLLFQLPWIFKFCVVTEGSERSIYEGFYEHNSKALYMLSKQAQDILEKWKKVRPGIYKVTESETGNLDTAMLEDIFTGEKRTYCFGEQSFLLPIEGDLVAGLLLPVPGNLFVDKGELIALDPAAEKLLKSAFTKKVAADGMGWQQYLSILEALHSTNLLT